VSAIRVQFIKGRIFEYACHEGNYALEGILSGARADEAAAAEKAKAAAANKTAAANPGAQRYQEAIDSMAGFKKCRAKLRVAAFFLPSVPCDHDRVPRRTGRRPRQWLDR